MSLRLYTALKTWRQTRHDHKAVGILPPAQRPAPGNTAEAANAAVYAAGIACAGQVAEPPNR